MIERIIEYSIRNRILVLLVAAVLTVWGIYAVLQTPVDAIPDLSENQVIVFTEWTGRSPTEIEDQITYPLSLKLQGLAGVKTIRSSSEFGFSMITIVFEDGVDFYFARQRVLEKLDEVRGGSILPPGVVPQLAPDATAVGQIFWYVLEPGPHHPQDPGSLWAVNKFYVIPQLNAVPGVAQVAAVGGAPLEYQIEVSPERLRAYGLTLSDLDMALSKANMPAGGHVLQKNNAEYLIRGVGWMRGKEDIENTLIKYLDGIPVYIHQVAQVQVGSGIRRSVFEKDGNEVVGGVVLMRHGENPLQITQAIKDKIREIQPGLPEGVRIVPVYDRTQLIQGAIHTLTDVMWHEMLIAALAILLILVHVRSVFVICVTLPLSVLFSFLLMWILRKLNILDVQANIMSLAGITISIGVLVDQAIVMTENATHTLRARFGERKISGDTTEYVLSACRLVGRPIFFSVLIMLLSFIPVFLLSGREGKYFRPLAFTKSFAMVGVALLSVTVVPALIPLLIKGRLRSEEENWIVRSLINIYKPFLNWALRRRNLVMWMFAAMLILAAGLFPVQAVFGLGASESAWRVFFLATFSIVTALTVAFTQGIHWQVLSFCTLSLLGLAMYNIDAKHRIGVEFIPPLDEGTIMDMPVTVPRASINQAIDDLKHRDALLRSFPEVESVAGKAGRADTPTDPAPLDMVETIVHFRPRQLWPHRVLKFRDAERQTAYVLSLMTDRGVLTGPENLSVRQDLINQATQKALERFDEIMRQLALLRYREFEDELSRRIVRYAVENILERLALSSAGELMPTESQRQLAEQLAQELAPEYGVWLARHPAIEDIDRLTLEVVERLAQQGRIGEAAQALAVPNPFRILPRAFYLGLLLIALFVLGLIALLRWYISLPVTILVLVGYIAVGGMFGWLGKYHWQYLVCLAQQEIAGKPVHLADLVFADVCSYRSRAWRERVDRINWELFDMGTELYTWYVIEELTKLSQDSRHISPDRAKSNSRHLVHTPAPGTGTESHADQEMAALTAILREAVDSFRKWVLFWPRQGGKNGDLVADEMQRVLQVPGWTNIFTMPIINRIDMLSTGVRTDIGVKVFGPDLETVDRVCRDIESALKPISGASDVIASPIVGKGYVEIRIDRVGAARYGIRVEEVAREIELVVGSRASTYIVDGRNRYAVVVRLARSSRQDEEQLRQLLIRASKASMGGGTAGTDDSAGSTNMLTERQGIERRQLHSVLPPHAVENANLIPLGAIADVRIIEGPVMIKSENGRLYNTVTLNVRGRDTLGFVEEAQRVVAQQVALPEGVSVTWSGEFEHQLRAAQTLRIAFPLVIVLIFIILYFTYKDVEDAALMMLAVPEAMAGGVFMLWLFPKLLNGWDAPPMNFSVAVWVGFIACFGMATETGIIMLVYLREAIERRGGLEKIKSLEELREAVIEGAAHRLRPKLLTEGVAILAIFPMVFTQGVGGEILAPMALPVLGGLLIADEVVDIFLPVRFYWVRRARWLKLQQPRFATQSLSAEEADTTRAQEQQQEPAGAGTMP